MADNERKPGITLADNGPLIVSRLENLRNSKGEALEARRSLALCRCGGSANKPYCDGTHRRNGFSSANTADRSADTVERYAGKEIDILDNRFVCAHIGECTARLEAVFRYGQEPWIDPDGGAADKVREAIAHCPSGALGYVFQGREVRDIDREPAITVGKNGPYYVVGGVELDADNWGQGASREHYALCRCGQSKNKPFCDGSHWDANFTDEKN